MKEAVRLKKSNRYLKVLAKIMMIFQKFQTAALTFASKTYSRKIILILKKSMMIELSLKKEILLDIQKNYLETHQISGKTTNLKINKRKLVKTLKKTAKRLKSEDLISFPKIGQELTEIHSMMIKVKTEGKNSIRMTFSVIPETN